MTLIGGIAGNNTKPKKAAPRSYADELNAALGAQQQIAPQLISAEGQYRPQFLDLDLAGAGQMAGGMLDLYQQLTPRAEAQRAGDFNSALGLVQGGLYNQGAMNRNATGAGYLMDSMVRDAQSQLDYGSQLDPVDRRTLQQGVRSAQAARGMGYGPSDVSSEALAELAGGQHLRQQRQGYAQNTAALAGQMTGNPFAQLYSMFGQGAAQPLASMGYSMGQQTGPIVFNPESQYNADISNQRFQADTARNLAIAKNKADLLAAGMSADAQIISSFAGGGK